MKTRNSAAAWIVGIIAILASVVVFLVPFAFILLDRQPRPVKESADLDVQPGRAIGSCSQNISTVLRTSDSGRAARLHQQHHPHRRQRDHHGRPRRHGRLRPARRKSRWNTVVNFFVLAGLIVPPAVVPTIWVLQGLGLFKTMPGHDPDRGRRSASLLHPAVPGLRRPPSPGTRRGRDRRRRRSVAAVLQCDLAAAQAGGGHRDRGAGGGRLQRLPEPALLPARQRRTSTVQLTLYNFQSQTLNQWNLLFTDILLITIPPLVMYIFFNRQIVAGMTAGAVKG